MPRATAAVALLIIMMGLTACVGRSAEARQEVQKVVRDYFDALNKSDPTSVMETIHRGPDSSMVSGGEVIRGWEAIRTEVDYLAGGENSDQKWSPGTMEVQSLDSRHALVVMPVTITISDREGSDQYGGAMTVVLVKDGDGWKILHVHTSLEEDEPEEDDGTSRS